MTADLLDQAFLQAVTGPNSGCDPAAGEPRATGPAPRAIARELPQTASPRPVSAAEEPVIAAAAAAATVAAVPAAVAVPEGASGPPEVAAAELSLRHLLERFPTQWTAVVTAVEAARRAGTRVIAVAGHQPGEGRTTLVQGLSLLLAERGWQVAHFPTAAAWWQELIGDGARWQHRLPPAATDNDLVLVDAGIWFSPGPLRPRQLLLKMFGFDGVLLMRHHGMPPCPARDGAIAAAGLRAIGEVVNRSPTINQREQRAA